MAGDIKAYHRLEATQGHVLDYSGKAAKQKAEVATVMDYDVEAVKGHVA